MAKGVCILLVIMMHTDVNVDFPGLRGMRMPLYFILSGLFFKDYGGFLNLLVKKANKILIPFLFFYLASYSIFYLIGWLSPDIIKSKEGIDDMYPAIPRFHLFRKQGLPVATRFLSLTK